MEKIFLEDLDMEELDILIDSAVLDLERNNLEYKSFKSEMRDILNKYENVSKLIDSDNVESLNNEECKMLQRILEIRIQLELLEDRAIYFLGGRQAYYYFKYLQLLK